MSDFPQKLNQDLNFPAGRKLPQPPGKSSTMKLISGPPNNINDGKTKISKTSEAFFEIYSFILHIDLAEGIKIAQRGRIDDQRGTEIRFEMPEFLKRPPVRF
jgi:hypothetical protein